MKNYVVYDKEGKVLRAGSCPNKDVVNQPQSGEQVIEVQAPLRKADLDYEIKKKKLVKKQEQR